MSRNQHGRARAYQPDRDPRNPAHRDGVVRTIVQPSRPARPYDGRDESARYWRGLGVRDPRTSYVRMRPAPPPSSAGMTSGGMRGSGSEGEARHA